MDQPPTETATASFSGTRWGLAGVLLPGYLLMLPTLGIYRFWQVTVKRRYYWNHTSIDGDALEYTGTALQLLIGFLIAVAFFLPLYLLLFYLSTTQPPEMAGLGYIGAAVFLYFLAGYAIYRARRFRLTRTLWRGIRLSQTGNAWLYALLRFVWTIAVILTAGLAYPFMQISLWRYRYQNTWYGDRKFGFSGSWRMLAGPFYGTYFLVLALLIGGTVVAVTGGASEIEGSELWSGLLIFVAALVAGLAYFYIRSRFTSRLMSSVNCGRARLKVHIRARSLFWIYFFYAFMFVLVTSIFAGIAFWAFSGLIQPLLDNDSINIRAVTQVGWVNLAVFGLLYLALLAAWGLLAETIIGLGYWRLVARNAIIENSDDLRTVRAHGEESPLTGEGLADALNVGAY